MQSNFYICDVTKKKVFVGVPTCGKCANKIARLGFAAFFAVPRKAKGFDRHRCIVRCHSCVSSIRERKGWSTVVEVWKFSVVPVVPDGFRPMFLHPPVLVDGRYASLEGAAIARDGSRVVDCTVWAGRPEATLEGKGALVIGADVSGLLADKDARVESLECFDRLLLEQVEAVPVLSGSDFLKLDSQNKDGAE